ncbi:hypothetical protein N7490_003320 [Penicillium lividum]|nr:hypothetical protein N7490_003320 [Penicillium lividum]
MCTEHTINKNNTTELRQISKNVIIKSSGLQTTRNKRILIREEWKEPSSEYICWWESSSNDLLWVLADPGYGKSILARSIIDNDL